MIRSGTSVNATRHGTDISMYSTARFWAHAATGIIAARETARHLRQQHRADRDADYADRQVIETIRIVERGNCAGGEEARDDGISEQRDLGSRRTKNRRAEGPEESLGSSLYRAAATREFWHTLRRAASDPPAGFKKAGNQHHPRRHVPRLETTHASASVITIDRLSRIGALRPRRKTPQRVENAAVQRHQRHQNRYGN